MFGADIRAKGPVLHSIVYCNYQITVRKQHVVNRNISSSLKRKITFHMNQKSYFIKMLCRRPVSVLDESMITPHTALCSNILIDNPFHKCYCISIPDTRRNVSPITLFYAQYKLKLSTINFAVKFIGLKRHCEKLCQMQILTVTKVEGSHNEVQSPCTLHCHLQCFPRPKLPRK